MTRYPIRREYLPYSLFAPPMSRSFVLLAQKFMKTPRSLFRDPALDVQTMTIPGYQGAPVEVLLLSLKGLSSPAESPISGRCSPGKGKTGCI